MNTDKSISQAMSMIAPHAATRTRLHGPDVLRGYAAIGVILFHVYYLSGAPRLPAIGFFVGRLDFFVRLFFTLSAFAIAYAYSSRLNGLEDIKKFYIKRFFRLAPLFYFVMLCGALLTSWQGRPGAGVFDYLLSLTFSFSFVPGKNGSLVGGGWSLGLEWLFYISFPFLLTIAGNLRTAISVWLVAGILAMASSSYFALDAGNTVMHNYGLLFFLAHLPFFIAGIACFHVFNVCKSRGLHISPRVSGLIAVVMLLLTLVYFYKGWSTKLPEEIYLSVAAFVFVFFGALGLPTYLDNRVTQYLGKISYSLYLMQFIVIGLFDHLGIFAWLCGLGFEPTYVYVLCAITTVITVIMMSALTYKFIEQPGMRLADRAASFLSYASFDDAAAKNAIDRG